MCQTICYIPHAEVCANSLMSILLGIDMDAETIITTAKTSPPNLCRLRAAPSQDTDTPPEKNGTNSL
jgi:hypothetical protein